MKKICLLFVLLLFNSVIYFSFAQKITTVNLNSNELSHHILDSISNNSIEIYLPPSYNDSIIKYPVLYFLPGYSCGYFSKSTLINNYQSGINSSNFKEMIVVFIDGCTANSEGCFYLNSEATGNWDDFIVSNVVSYIDSNFRTIVAPDSRAIAGHSMGGFGAINLAMLHPDVFGSLYSHSPGLFSNTGLEDCQMFENNTNIEAYISLDKELSVMSKHEAHAEYLKRLSSMNNDLRFTIEYGMAVAPNVNKNAPYTDFPYTKVNNILVKIDSLWDKWDSGFGSFDTKVSHYKSNFLTLDTFVIDYGTDDSYEWIPEGCQYLSTILSSNEIPYNLTSYSGGHSKLTRYSTNMFPILMNSLTFDTLSSTVDTLSSTVDTLSSNNIYIPQSHSNQTNIIVSYDPNYSIILIHLLDARKEKCHYKLIDINGRIIKNGNLSEKKYINTSDLTKGLYIINVLNKGKLYTSKILIN